MSVRRCPQHARADAGQPSRARSAGRGAASSLIARRARGAAVRAGRHRHRVGAHHEPRILYMLLSLGLNIVVGFAGLLDLGYIAFYAVGAYVYALLAVAALRPAPAVLGHPADRRAGRVHVRRAARRADAEAARRLPRDRHARLRRDHPHLPQQPVAAGQHHQRPAGHHADRPVPHRRLQLRADARRSAGSTFSGPIKYYYLLLLVLLGRHRASTCGCRIRASAAPGRRSARTRSRRARWASTRAT